MLEMLNLAKKFNEAKASFKAWLKEDKDKDGRADLLERLDEAEAGCDALKKFISRYDSVALEKIMIGLDAMAGVEIDPNVKEYAKQIVLLPPALDALKAGLEELEKKIEKGDLPI